jgi:hypothetical protein
MEISDSELEPLKIPSGWKVVINKFYNIDPETLHELNLSAEDTTWMFFDNTLLLLEHTTRELVLDMGWYPMWEPDGNYGLVVFKLKNSEQKFLEKSSKSKKEIVDLINKVLATLSCNDWYEKLKQFE